MRALFVVVVLGLATPAFAAAPPDRDLDGLFTKLAKVHSSEEAKPIEEEILTHFLRSDSATVDLLMSHASALASAGDEGSAMRVLDAVTHIAPSYAEGWHQKGKLEADAGKDEAALASLQRAVTLNPREFEAHVDLGELEAQYGAKPAALVEFKKALALDPNFEGLDKRVQSLARDVEGDKI